MIEDLLNNHLNDNAILKKFKKINSYNEREYSEPISIKCKKFKQVNIITNSNNETITSTIHLYTLENINDKDNIDGKDILQIKELYSLIEDRIIGYDILL